jgi:hypothetical protein
MRRTAHLAIASLVAWAFVPLQAEAQTPFAPTGKPHVTMIPNDGELKVARHLARKGDFVRLRDHFRKVLISLCGDRPKPCDDFRRDTFRVSFIGQPPAAAVGLVSVFVHDPAEDRPLLQGIAGPRKPFIDIFLSEDDELIETSYISTPDVDPLASAASTFVQGVLPKLVFPGSLSTTVGGVRMLGVSPDSGVIAARQREMITVRIATLNVPHPRSTVKVDDVVIAPSSVDRVLRWAQEATDELSRDVSDANSFATVSVALRQALRKKADECASSPSDKCVGDWARAAETALGQVQQRCPACSMDFVPRLVVEYSTALATVAATYKSSSSVPNVPRSHVTFGFGTVLMSHATLTDRAAVRARVGNDSKYTPDPLMRTATLGIVNVGLGRRADDRKYWRQCCAGMFGVSLTPSFGAALGGSLFVPKLPLVVTAGRMWFAVDQISSEQINQPVSNERKAAPLDTGRAAAWFLGLGYIISASK